MSTNRCKNPKYDMNLMQIHPVGVAVIHADGQAVGHEVGDFRLRKRQQLYDVLWIMAC